MKLSNTLNIEIFVFAFVILSTITSLLTEAVKQCLDNLQIKYISEIIVLIVDAFVSIGGGVFFYIFNDIAFSTKSIMALVCMLIAVFIGSEIGYDKVIELLDKVKTWKK